MNVAQDIDWWNQFEEDGLLFENFFCRLNQKPYFLFLENIRLSPLSSSLCLVDGIPRVLIVVDQSLNYVVQKMGGEAPVFIHIWKSAVHLLLFIILICFSNLAIDLHF